MQEEQLTIVRNRTGLTDYKTNNVRTIPSGTILPRHTSDLKIGTPVDTLPGAWRYRVSAGIGWPDVSIL